MTNYIIVEVLELLNKYTPETGRSFLSCRCRSAESNLAFNWSIKSGPELASDAFVEEVLLKLPTLPIFEMSIIIFIGLDARKLALDKIGFKIRT